MQKMEMAQLDTLQQDKIDTWSRVPIAEDNITWVFGSWSESHNQTLLAEFAEGGGIHLCDANGDPNSKNPSLIELHDVEARLGNDEYLALTAC
eukprot:CAMPEP_0194506126 /NCGR_PEP_ID=MMETSP0253-20130528/33895_1 /TAXON_ID=2966 /ORGANISM="Noctiluca scintillans" /LENGTH=92 /DNA_ID=CAMNT_0039348785 /DNA_START=66 /DNA_END=344 /DNA_ORIENTATION=-